MTPFRWRNCYADVVAAKHDLTIQSFLDDVIRPAISALDARIVGLSQSDEPSACFVQSDTEEILAKTKKAFALSVQSIWERQLREYLIGCAGELRPGEGLEVRVEKAQWKTLCALFQELRGIALEDFPSFAVLDTLHLLGNACRHGEGASASELARRCSDWWPDWEPMPEFGVVEPPKLSVARMDVPLDSIAVFVAAIVSFWADASYIYKESIARKHPGLEAELRRERAMRTWRPYAPMAQ